MKQTIMQVFIDRGGKDNNRRCEQQKAIGTTKVISGRSKVKGRLRQAGTMVSEWVVRGAAHNC